MDRVSRRVRRDAAGFLHAVGAAGADPEGFARVGVTELPRFVASELTTLSVCDLVTGRRRVVGNPEAALSGDDIAAFDRHFFEHPLVRFHSAHPRGGTHRISDSMSAREFRRGALYNDYYRRIGIDHAVAIPLHVDGATLVSFVLNRSGRDFSNDEVALFEQLRGWLAAMYRNALALQRASEAMAQLREIVQAQAVRLDGQRRVRELSRAAALTRREREVLDWVAAGKSDRQIATILGTSPRTVQKHLEHVYVKLGVENRTAAAMRARAGAAAAGGADPAAA